MRLSYITVCVNYLDYFRVAYQHNRSEFSDFTIVTSPSDTDTQMFCRDNRLDYVVTDAFYRNGTVFNKGLALNEGLIAAQQERPLEWVALLDADTFVPPTQPRAILPTLDKEWFYGCERYLLPTFEDYLRYINSAGNDTSFACPRGFGFGYIQLFHWDSAVIKGLPYGRWYPESRDCTECDWRFMNLYGGLIKDYAEAVGRVAKLPFRVYNLGKHGQDHFGRRSPQFTS